MGQDAPERQSLPAAQNPLHSIMLVVKFSGVKFSKIRAATKAAGGLIANYEFDLYHSGETASSLPIFNRLKQELGFEATEGRAQQSFLMIDKSAMPNLEDY
jgi:hypothetical protein